MRVSLVAQINARSTRRMEQKRLPTTLNGDDTVIHVRVQAIGKNPTRLQGKVWWGGEEEDEPESWTISATQDKTAALQRPGGIGMTSYLSKEAATSNATVSFFEIVARKDTI